MVATVSYNGRVWLADGAEVPLAQANQAPASTPAMRTRAFLRESAFATAIIADKLEAQLVLPFALRIATCGWTHTKTGSVAIRASVDRKRDRLVLAKGRAATAKLISGGRAEQYS